MKKNRFLMKELLKSLSIAYIIVSTMLMKAPASIYILVEFER